MSSLVARRAAFFDYFRDRLTSLRSENVSPTDRIILLSVLLDALANHWMASSEHPAQTSHAERMRRFLVRHGGHEAWGRVSAPLLRRHLVDADAIREIEARFPFDRYQRGRMNLVATWRDDPEFDALLQSGIAKPELVSNCSFPGIVYKQVRCGWVHESRPGDEDVETPGSDDLADGEPRYQWVSNTERFILRIPITFLIATAASVITSFERETGERDVLPFGERDLGADLPR